MPDSEKEKDDQPTATGGQDSLPNGGAASSSLTLPPIPQLTVSKPSSALIEESMRLLDLKSSVPPTFCPESFAASQRPSAVSFDDDLPEYRMPRYPKPTPRFKRIDFDDRLEHLCDDKKPAWKTWQESIKESYQKAKRSVERNKDETQFLESTLARTRRSRAESPFRHLDRDTGFIPSVRSQSSLMMPSLSDRSAYASNYGRSYACLLMFFFILHNSLMLLN
ncbi:unnamed protein product [Nippostrongylus brasiliensis]|uniref:Uncharacterized protein n=1 Tax=Nippostrongylus brasiliensis TaxID=27835 RepID=A0A0N4Y2T0_NIPBR|nr:unnamed protein product [Nippostrongylus brasiliensis]